MEPRLIAACRGDGVAYALVSLGEGSLADYEFNAFADNGELVPMLALPVAEAEIERFGLKGCCAIFAFPLLAIAAVSFAVMHSRKGGAHEIELSFESLKWHSRLLYRANPSLAAMLRDSEKKCADAPAAITISSFIPNRPLEQEYLFKATIASQLGDSAIRAYFIDGEGRIDTGIPVHKGNLDHQPGRTNLEISARIPKDKSTCTCLVVETMRGDTCAFLNFDDSTTRHFAEVYDAVDYRLAREPLHYQEWISAKEPLLFASPPEDTRVRFSVVVQVPAIQSERLHEALRSISGQTYPNWEAVVVCAKADEDTLRQELEQLGDGRIAAIQLKGDWSASASANAGIVAATGDYICLLDQDDVLSRSALAECRKAIAANPQAVAIYSDEDRLEHGVRANPVFKPDFNIDLLRSCNYINRFLGVNAAALEDLKLDCEYSEAMHYDLALRLSETGRPIVHIPAVLHHKRATGDISGWEPSAYDSPDKANMAALERHLERSGLDARTSPTDNPGVYRVDYELPRKPLVSIIIPNKDNAGILGNCLESLLGKTSYPNFEVVIVENNSTEPETFAYYEQLQSDSPQCKVITWEGEFNYAAINNFAAKEAKGEYLVLLNNDTEVISADWLEQLLSYCQREDVGIAGAKLLYPDDTVQHAGVFLEQCIDPFFSAGPDHVFAHIDRDDPGYCMRAVFPQDLSAVTAACLMVKRALYDQVGGLDESFKVAYNDIDFCLRIRELGYLVVFNPAALLYHYESLSRGKDMIHSHPEKRANFLKEQGLMRARWSKYYACGDPMHSMHIRAYHNLRYWS